MAEAEPKPSRVNETLWGLLFAVCLGLAVAHLTLQVRSQEEREGQLIHETFTEASR
jgi:hypothetical protein